MSSDEAIKVAVRVRPFNDREKQRNATLVISMSGNTTSIKDPSNPKDPKNFSFDYSYWSHDGFTTESNGYMKAENNKYIDQMKVFDDLGRGVLDNAWKGYNCCLFAYGQTGSGKSYSMVGYGTNKGIVPIACEELFKQIDSKGAGSGTEYQVTVSMLEIYCERVRDLLDNNPPPKGGLKVREHPKKGFYVENLIASAVGSYAAIEAKINEGTKNRTVAATNMNATSSRAHTIVQINFTQQDKSANTTKTSGINLVDLAGSERQQDSGAEGDRLKEGIVINQSLSTLGRCIKALADIQKGDKGVKGRMINLELPFRDSVLTSLLKNALGGNSKTIMIAALSPADINYEETLSTLRFADRAKSIKTSASINESATDKLIRELREENAKLMAMLKGGGGGGGGGTGDGSGGDSEEVQALRMQLERNEQERKAMEESWQKRLSEEAANTKGGVPKADEVDAKRKSTPHFWNLNEDPALTNKVVHFLKPGDNRIGLKSSKPPPDIVLTGLSILKEHAVIKCYDGYKKVTLTPLPGTKMLVNGKEIQQETELTNYDRILFGGNHLYAFSHPLNAEQQKKSGKKFKRPTYEVAQSEIAENSGIMGMARSNAAGGAKSKDDMILEDDLVRLWPQVTQANAMSDELKKTVKFEIVLVAPQARGKKTGQTEVFVKIHNYANDNEFYWDKAKFVNQYYGMQEMYQNFTEGYNDWNLPSNRDPFFISSDTEVMIGCVQVYLQSLAYMVEVDEQLPIMDFKGMERGQLKVGLVPCNPDGKEIVGEFVDSPEELSRCKYRFYEESEMASLEVNGQSPPYGHAKMFSYKPVTKSLIEYLKDSALVIDVYGKQSDKAVSNKRPPAGAGAAAQGGDGSGYKVKSEQLENKLDQIQRLLENALTADAKSLDVQELQKALNAAGGGGGGGGGGGDKPKKRSGSKKREPSTDKAEKGDKKKPAAPADKGDKPPVKPKKAPASAGDANDAVAKKPPPKKPATKSK